MSHSINIPQHFIVACPLTSMVFLLPPSLPKWIYTRSDKAVASSQKEGLS